MTVTEITRDDWAALSARQQVKADRRWNRRRDLAVGAIGLFAGGAVGCGLAVLRAVL
jgi:hypothetical protein